MYRSISWKEFPHVPVIRTFKDFLWKDTWTQT